MPIQFYIDKSVFFYYNYYYNYNNRCCYRSKCIFSCAFIRSLMRRFYFKYTGHSQLHVRHYGIQMHFVLSFLRNIIIRHYQQWKYPTRMILLGTLICKIAFACNLQGYLFFVIVEKTIYKFSTEKTRDTKQTRLSSSMAIERLTSHAFYWSKVM